MSNQISGLQLNTKIRNVETNIKFNNTNKFSYEKSSKDNLNDNLNILNERFLNGNKNTNFKKTDLQENNFLKNSHNINFLTINNPSNPLTGTNKYSNNNLNTQTMNITSNNYFANFNNIHQKNQSKIYNNNKDLNKISNPLNNVIYSKNNHQSYYGANINLLEQNIFDANSKNEMKSINPIDRQLLLKQMDSLKLNEYNKTNMVYFRNDFNNLTSSFQDCNPQLSHFTNDGFNNPNILKNLNGNSNINFNEKANIIKKIPDQQNEKKKKRPFVERVGDWVCFQCKNLNFSFRTSCNRCQLSKFDNQNLIDDNKKR